MYNQNTKADGERGISYMRTAIGFVLIVNHEVTAHFMSHLFAKR